MGHHARRGARARFSASSSRMKQRPAPRVCYRTLPPAWAKDTRARAQGERDDGVVEAQEILEEVEVVLLQRFGPARASSSIGRRGNARADAAQGREPELACVEETRGSRRALDFPLSFGRIAVV